MVDHRFHAFSGTLPLGELLARTGHEGLVPASGGDKTVAGANELTSAGPDEIALAASKTYGDALRATGAGIVVVAPDLRDRAPTGAVCVVSDNAHGVFADILDHLYPQDERTLLLAVSQDPARDAAIIEDGAVISPGATIGSGAEVGRGTIIGPGAVIGTGVTIGRDCLIGANVTIECAHIGDRVVVKSGARIGSPGFGWLELGTGNRKIPQLGRAILQDDVEVGANSMVDRGALGDTVVGEGSKIDNLVQIGHNCRIGRKCLIAGMCGLAGSTVLEDGVLMGAGAGTEGHITIGEGSRVIGKSVVTRSWPAGSHIAGTPAQRIEDAAAEYMAMRRILRDRAK